MTNKMMPVPTLQVIPLSLGSKHDSHAVLVLQVVGLGRFPVAERGGAAIRPLPGVLKKANLHTLRGRRSQHSLILLC